MKQVFMPLLFAFLLSSCEDCRFVLWMDNNVEACGVSDPLTNLDWLNKKINEPFSPFTLIHLYQDTVMDEPVFVFHVKHFISVHDCSGEDLVDGGAYNGLGIPPHVTEGIPFDKYYQPKKGIYYVPPKPCDMCDSLFRNYQYVSTIYKYYLK